MYALRPLHGNQNQQNNREVPPAHTQDYAAENVHDFPQQAAAQEYISKFGRYFNIKVHSSKAALEMKPTLTRSGWSTVMLEATSANGHRRYDWDNKTCIQITRTELPIVAAVFLGIKKQFSAKNHGEQNNKGFELSWQNNNNLSLFVKVFEANKPLRAIPVSPFEAMQMGHILAVQYVENFPSLTVDAFITSLKQLTSRGA